MPKKSIFEWAKISIVIEFIVEFLSRFLKIPKDKLWPLIDSIQRELLRRGIIDNTLNDYIINTPVLLEQRVERDVDKAISEFEKTEVADVNMKNVDIINEIQKSKYTDEERQIVMDANYYESPPDDSNAQDLLGGEMGIKADWVDK